MNEQTRNAIDMAYAADIAGMQSAIQDLVKSKILDALEGKKQEVARELTNNTNEEKCCDELSPKQKKKMDVDDDEDIDEKDLKALRKKRLKKEEVSEGLELTKKKTMYKNPALPGTIADDRASGKFKKTLKKLNAPKGK